MAAAADELRSKDRKIGDRVLSSARVRHNKRRAIAPLRECTFQDRDWPAVSLAGKLRRRERMRIRVKLDEPR
jgi:hypothetical protein